MKKLSKSILLGGISLALLATAIAPFSNKHAVQTFADGHTHDEVTFEPWENPFELPNSGNYYLATDVEVGSTWKPSNNTRLCLNGHGIRMTGTNRFCEVPAGGNLYIHDCANTPHRYYIDEKTKLGVVDDSLESDYETFTGGYITGGNATGDGGAFLLPPGSSNGSQTTLYMFAGTLIGNKATGDGGAIAYKWTSRRNSALVLNNINIIGNVADGTAGGIYHGANNKLIDLKNAVIKDNVSGSAPAGVLATSYLYLNSYIYLYDNYLKDGTRSDLTLSHSGQNDLMVVQNALDDGTKIGFDEIRRNYIKDFYFYNKDVDPNEVFISHNNSILGVDDDDTDRRNDAVIYKASATSVDVPYDGQPHSVTINEVDTLHFKPTITYGTSEGKYDLTENPSFTLMGTYNVYFKFERGQNISVGSATVNIQKLDPTYTSKPTAIDGLSYTGQPQKLITSGSTSDGTIYYRLGEEGEWSTSASVCNATDVGTYTCYYKIVGDSAHKDSEIESIVVSIAGNDKTELVNKIAAVTEYYNSIKDSYVPVGEALNEAIKAAIVVQETVNVTKEEITEAINALTDAYDKAVYDIEMIKYVNTLIMMIGEVTLEKEDKIVAAREAYDTLDEALLVYVDSETLFAAESRLADLKAADNVIKLIDAIGEVTYPDSGEAIKAAKSAYDALSEEQLTLIDADHVTTLNNAIATYKDLEDHAYAQKVMDLIDAIGKVTYPDSGAAIKAAKDAYDALSEDQLALVDADHVIILNNAINTYNDLEDQTYAQEVMDLIDAIGEVKYPDSLEAINKAKNAYDALNETRKALVDKEHLDKLNNAIAAYFDLENKYYAQIVMDLIDAIGEVKFPESLEAINKAKNAYDALNETRKALVDKEHLDKLNNAIATYIDLENRDYAQKVMDLIDAIGVVKYPDSEQLIIKASEAYDRLSDAQKAYVDGVHLNALHNAITLFASLKDKALANNVIDLINAIGEVDTSTECKTRIDAARAAYEALSEDQKALVTNYNLLVRAEKTYVELTNPNYTLPIVLSVVGGVLLLLVLAYFLMFFVFNKWIKKDDKFVRAVKLGKKNDKIKLMLMSFRIEYRDESEVYKSKSDIK